MVVVSWSLLVLIANTQDGSCDEAGVLCPSLILSGAKAARKVEKMGEIPSNGPTPYRSIRLKRKKVRGSHEVARRKHPGDFGFCFPGTKSSHEDVDRGRQMVLANLDRHQLVHMSLSCWRGPDNRRRPPVRAVLLGNRQTTLIGERTISRRSGMPFCMVHGAPLLGDVRGAPLHRAARSERPGRPLPKARVSTIGC